MTHKWPLAERKLRNMADIENIEAVTGIFGCWPSFHDAEVLSVRLDRCGPSAARGPTIDTKIHVFEMTSEVDERGFYVCRFHTLVTLRFLQVENLRIDDFNCQNALWGLEIIDVSARQMEDVKFEVHFSPSFGVGMDFVCKAVLVVAAEPWDRRLDKTPSVQSPPRSLSDGGGGPID